MTTVYMTVSVMEVQNIMDSFIYGMANGPGTTTNRSESWRACCRKIWRPTFVSYGSRRNKFKSSSVSSNFQIASKVSNKVSSLGLLWLRRKGSPSNVSFCSKDSSLFRSGVQTILKIWANTDLPVADRISLIMT